MTEQELRAWAEARVGSCDAVALAVWNLFAKIDNWILSGHFDNTPVLDRALAIDASVLPEIIGVSTDGTIYKSGGRVERPFDGSTGTPDNKSVGRKEDQPPGASQ